MAQLTEGLHSIHKALPWIQSPALYETQWRGTHL